MKRIFVCLVAVLIILNTSLISFSIALDNSTNLTNIQATNSSSPQNKDKITILLNGAELTFDVEPYIKSGRTLVPFRGILEALGAQVGWNPDERSVTAKSESTEIYLKIGDSHAYVNGRKINIDVPAEIKNGRTFLPLRFMSENLGAYVGWDGDTRTVSIEYEVSNNKSGTVVEKDGTKITVDKVEFVSEDKKLFIYGKVNFNGRMVFLDVIDTDGYSIPAFFESVGDEEDMRSFTAVANTHSNYYFAKYLIVSVRSDDGKMVKIAEITL